MIWDVHHGSGSWFFCPFRIPDPGIIKTLDPGSRIRIRSTAWKYQWRKSDAEFVAKSDPLTNFRDERCLSVSSQRWNWYFARVFFRLRWSTRSVRPTSTRPWRTACREKTRTTFPATIRVRLQLDSCSVAERKQELRSLPPSGWDYDWVAAVVHIGIFLWNPKKKMK